jgi:hypothetical protein
LFKVDRIFFKTVVLSQSFDGKVRVVNGKVVNKEDYERQPRDRIHQQQDQDVFGRTAKSGFLLLLTILSTNNNFASVRSIAKLNPDNFLDR